MQVHRNIELLPPFRNAVVTIGTFDGVHTGHRQILKQLKEEAANTGGESVLITFHPHPRKVLGTGKDPVLLINTIEEKTALLEKAGIDHLVIVPFTESFSQLSAREYVEDFLVSKFKPHTVIIGYDHHFGKGRQGNYRLLEEYSAAGAFSLREIPAHLLHQNTVSSTSIRKAVLEGRIEEANELLGYDFFFEGKVVEGNKIGRQLGYPTANLEIASNEKLIPGNGIYAVTVQLMDASKRSEQVIDHSPRLKGMMSIGVRPTIGVSHRTIEVNIFDFNDQIYGSSLRVYVKKFMRPELKFDGLEALRAKISEDEQQARKLLG
jgi:riboflavin kinase/FMN adenylyltransferase